LTSEAERTVDFLQTQTARVTIRKVNVVSGRLDADVFVENLTGHKLPTAFPSRRTWLHVIVRDHNGQTVFESGALNPDGSIKGNVNDVDASRFAPHYREITSSDQVEIYEPILKDQDGHVTTGLAAAVGYLKDNRLLPAGFQKQSADKDIAVVGDAADDPNFTDAGDLVHYSAALADAKGPFKSKPSCGINRSVSAGRTIWQPTTHRRPNALWDITIPCHRQARWCWRDRKLVIEEESIQGRSMTSSGPEGNSKLTPRFWFCRRVAGISRSAMAMVRVQAPLVQ
jgi:hypothetical protein